MNKPKLNEPDVEMSLTTPRGESISINKTIPNKQFKDYIKNYIKPTEEEIIQEAKKLGYEYESDYIFITLVDNDKYIKINKSDKTYISYFYYQYIDYTKYRSITCEEHLLITKILVLLGGIK